MKIPKLWYTVKELAQQLDCAEDDVLHQIQICTLHPSFYLPQTVCRVNGEERVGYGIITPVLPQMIFCMRPLNSDWKDDLTARSFYPGPPVHKVPSIPLDYITPLGSVPVTVNDFIIVPEELERFKATYCKDNNIEPKTNDDQQKNECQLDPMSAIVGWKAIADAIGKSADYAKKYCKGNGIRVEHDKAGKPWTTLEEIARSRATK